MGWERKFQSNCFVVNVVLIIMANNINVDVGRVRYVKWNAVRVKVV